MEHPASTMDVPRTNANTPKTFLSLPSEVRNDIYKQLLVLEEPVALRNVIWNGYFVRFGTEVDAFPVDLFRANRTVHREATSMLYAQNRFDFSSCTLEQVALFLSQIGSNNASCIRHIRIDFPRFRHLGCEDVTFEDQSLGKLEKLQHHCTNLATITTNLDSTNDMEVIVNAHDCPKIIPEAMELANTRLRAFTSLEEIAVEVYENGPSEQIRREMRRHGWKIITHEYVEETHSDRFFDEYDYNDFDYDYSNDGDEYDIDNDSDFWRRAGD